MITTKQFEATDFKSYAQLAAILKLNKADKDIAPLTGMSALYLLAKAQHELFNMQIALNAKRFDDMVDPAIQVLKILGTFAYSHLGRLKPTWWDEVNVIFARPEYTVLNAKDEFEELLIRWKVFVTSILSSQHGWDLLTPTFRNNLTNTLKPIFESIAGILTILHQWPLELLMKELNTHLLNNTRQWVLLTENNE